MASAAPWGLEASTKAAIEDSFQIGEEKSSEKSIHNHIRRDSPKGSTLGRHSTDEQRDEEKVHDLARGLSRVNTQNPGKDEHGEFINPFHGSSDPRLDPNSGKFSARAWIKTLIGIASRDPERYPQRVAGVAYRNLGAHGFGEPTDYQKTFGNYLLELPNLFKKLVGRGKKTRIQILRDFEGLIKSGEVLVVLGRPGRLVRMPLVAGLGLMRSSGCSTLLKAISGETDGFWVEEDAYLNYQGIPKETMHNDFRGECIYQAEVDVHFPGLTVGQTLTFAALARVGRGAMKFSVLC